MGAAQSVMADSLGINIFLILRSAYEGSGDLGWSILVGEQSQGKCDVPGSDWEVINDKNGIKSSHQGFMDWYGKWGKGENVLEWVMNYPKHDTAEVGIRGFWIMGGSLKSLAWSFEEIEEENGWRFRWLPVEFVNLCQGMKTQDGAQEIINKALMEIKNKVAEMIRSDFILNFAIKDGLITRKGYGEMVKNKLEEGGAFL